MIRICRIEFSYRSGRQSGVTTTSTSAAGSGGTTAAGSGDSTTAAGSGDSTTAGGTTGAPGDGETTTEMQSGSIGQGNSGATAAMCVLPSLGLCGVLRWPGLLAVFHDVRKGPMYHDPGH